jgi:hypothetical protein
MIRKLSFIPLMLLVLAASGQQKVPKGDSSISPSPNGGECYGTITIATPGTASVCPQSTVQFVAMCLFRPYHEKRWEQSIDGGNTWTTIPGTSAVITTFGGTMAADTLTLSNVSLSMNGYKYRCYMNSGCLSSNYYSAPSTLWVYNTTTITAEPADAADICIGLPVNFSVTVTGGDLGYQWQLSTDGGSSFGNIASANSATYSPGTALAAMNNNRYRCMVSSGCFATVYSQAALLTVNPAAFQITGQPSNTVACPGSTAVFTVSASAAATNFQWQQMLHNGPYTYVDMPGQVSPVLSIPGVTLSLDQSRYRCRIGGNCNGYFYSNGALLESYDDFSIATHPVSQQKCTGDYITFSTTPSSSFNVRSTQWQRSTDGGIVFTDIPSATSSVYSFYSTAGMNNYKYRCRMSNPCYMHYSDTATLLLDAPLAVTSQPVNATECSGTAASFTAVASGSLAANHHQWQVSTDGGSSFTNLGAAVSSNTVLLPAITAGMNGYRYRCMLLSNCTTAIYSDVVVLTVIPGAFLGADSVINLACQECTANIAAAYNTAAYAIANWSTPSPAAAQAGSYQLNVASANGCTDTAKVFVNFNDGYTIRTCPGSRVSITADNTGTTYQWQRKYNNGYGFDFNDIAGATSRVLFTDYLIPYDSIAQYRCVVNSSIYGNVFSIKLTSLWNGNAGTLWNNPANWGCGSLPDANTDVVISSGTVVVNVNTTIRSLKLSPGVNFSVAPGVTLTVLH